MPTIPNYPQSLLDEHHHWHSHPGHPELGGRAFSMGSPGSGLEFLTFHRTFMTHFHTWYDVQPGHDAAAVAPWPAIPPELKVAAAGWSSTWAADETRITTNNPPFATADELGIFIETRIHNNFLHSAAGTIYNEPLLFSPMTSPQSTHFYQLHGLITNWWNHWASLQKAFGKDVIDHKHFHKEFVKEVKEFKEKDIFEGGGRIDPGDPIVRINQLGERLSLLENQIATGQAFIRPQERPEVGSPALHGDQPESGTGSAERNR